jgi:hypothetical protein
MAMRVKFLDLSGYDPTKPFKVTINCAYWFLRITDASLSATVDNCPVVKLVTGQGADKPLAGIDFPPVFDAEGRPVMWNHELAFNGAGAAIAGVVVQVYWDPDTPKG